jgi:hypothetical protein
VFEGTTAARSRGRQSAASRHEPTLERMGVAFGCCNGRFGSSDPRFGESALFSQRPRPESPKHDGRKDETDDRAGAEPMEPSPVPFGIRRRRPSACPRVEDCEVRKVEGAANQRHAQNHSKKSPRNHSPVHRSSAELLLSRDDNQYPSEQVNPEAKRFHLLYEAGRCHPSRNPLR